MHIALTGASGFIGSTTARKLHEAGHTVAALVRSSSMRDHIEPYVDRFVEGTQADESCWPALLDGAECVIHNSVDWAPLRAKPVDLDAHLWSNLAGSIKLLHAAAPRQFVFVSSIATHHDMLEQWGGTIDETHPLRPSMLYGAYKAAVEPHLWAAHFGPAQQHTCAVRPCGVYGIDPDLPRSHGYDIVKSIQDGKPITRQGGGKFVHVEDVAAALVAAVGNKDAAAQPFNLVDCYARWADWAKIACELLGKKVPIDDSSPASPKNTFSKERTHSVLGVPLDRSNDGIRTHLAQLIEKMNAG